MHSPSPPFLAGIDFTAVAWAAGWALIFSLSLLPNRRRWQVKAGQTPTPWWVVILESCLGGVVGGVLFAIAIPELWPGLRRAGLVALLAVVGAACGPLLGRWIPEAMTQVIAFVSEKRFGVRIEVKAREDAERGEGDADVADKT